MKIQLYNVVLVDQYVNRMISQFLNFSSDLSQGDILIADKINKLLQKSRYMLKNIDSFMNKNCLDPRVSYLYVTRNKLFKFIQKIQQNKLIKQVNSIQASQNSNFLKQSPRQQPFTNPKQHIESHKRQTSHRFEDIDHKAKTNKKLYEMEGNLSEFSSFQRKEPSFNKNIKKPDPIKIQPDSPAFLKAKTPTKPKPNHQQDKPLYDNKKPKQISTINPVIKTSKKLESFTPVKNSSSKFANQNWKAQKTARQTNQKPKGTSVFQKSALRNQNLTPESKRTQKTERTPTKGTGEKRMITESHLYNEYSNGSGGKVKANKGEEPSSAIKNLSNLIFTIKMTREEYNEFKKIKEQHEGKYMEE